MKNNFPGGVWPVMITPFHEQGAVDYKSLTQLVNWYIGKGVAGLFAVCQSSEMFYLSLEERIAIAEHVVNIADKRVPVIASGHVSDDEAGQVEEINSISKTGVDAVILITNRLAKEDESDEVWMQRLLRLLDRMDEDLPLGLYECPYPYKRLLSKELINKIAATGRFHFLKDTCCSLEQILERQLLIQHSNLKLYNANTATLLPALRHGIAGYSGVMANFHPELYVWLCENDEHEKAETLQELLTTMALIERQVYPVNAKYALQNLGILDSLHTRSRDAGLLDNTARSEVDQMMGLSQKIGQWLMDVI